MKLKELIGTLRVGHDIQMCTEKAGWIFNTVSDSKALEPYMEHEVDSFESLKPIYRPGPTRPRLKVVIKE